MASKTIANINLLELLSRRRAGKLDVYSHGDRVDILIFTGLPRDPHLDKRLKYNLGENLPGARILTWHETADDAFIGPPAKVANFGHQILLRLRDERSGYKKRRKPIILVGLSLGGLVLKHALLLAARDPDLQSTIECIQAVLFVGTPHREDEGQEYGQILVNAARHTYAGWYKDSLWNCLHDNSEDFRKLTSAWHLLPNFPIYSFYETKPSDSIDRVVVGKHSATLGVQNEVHVSVNATHSELNKMFEKEKSAFSNDVSYSGLSDLFMDETSVDEKSAYQIVHKTLEILTRREHLQKRYPVSKAQTGQVLPLLPNLLEKKCPVCASLPSGGLPVGSDALHLEWMVDVSPSIARQLRVWRRECGIAAAAEEILRHWRSCDDVFSAKYEERTPYIKQPCIPPSNEKVKFMINMEHGKETHIPFDGKFDWVVHADPLSEVTKRQMRSWIDECDKHHSCRRQTSPAPDLLHSTSENNEKSVKAARPNDFLPTRLLDVRDLGHIRLCEQEDLQESDVDKYATLSHCWGSSRIFLTTKESISRMKRGFDVSQQIPKTFRDAIVVTHELGAPYLWIDSLCIIQDDIADWDREASHMARVYTNAYISIAALDSVDDAIGFLHLRPFPYTTLRLASTTGESANVYLNQVERDSERPQWREYPLRTRAWVLQEQYLSPRILWFSSTKLGWNCKKVAEAENGIVGCDSTVPDLGSTQWRDVFTDFSKRSLTYDTDKLPALMGVASAFSALSALSGKDRGPYCAGLWKDTLMKDLMFSWRNPTCPSRYLAPSWSWAALNGGVTWLDGTFFAGYELFDGVTAVDCDMKLVSNNRYGHVMEGSSITVSSPMIRLGPRTSAVPEGQEAAGERYEVLEGGCKGQTLWCRFDLPHVQPAEIFGMLLAQGTDKASAHRGYLVMSVVGIVITPVEGSERGYKRVGFFGKDWIEGGEIKDLLNSYPPQEVYYTRFLRRRVINGFLTWTSCLRYKMI